jgi:hypothetical protein
MPLTFAQAYAIVCPDGGEVIPHSQKFNDILELMRQSGYKNFRDTLVEDSAPRKPRTVQEAMPFIETRQTLEKPLHVSRRQWMSVQANKQAFINALNKNKTSS